MREVLWLAEPLDGLLEANPEALDANDLWLPAQNTLGLGVIAKQSLDLRVLRANAVRVFGCNSTCPHKFVDHVEGLADRNLKANA